MNNIRFERKYEKRFIRFQMWTVKNNYEKQIEAFNKMYPSFDLDEYIDSYQELCLQDYYNYCDECIILNKLPSEEPEYIGNVTICKFRQVHVPKSFKQYMLDVRHLNVSEEMFYIDKRYRLLEPFMVKLGKYYDDNMEMLRNKLIEHKLKYPRH